MYDRGALDAANDELNPFYYQHYYYYRKGYDDTRRQMRRGQRSGRGRLLASMGIAIVILLGAGIWWASRSVPSSEALAPASPAPAPTAAAPTSVPTLPPPPMPEPTAPPFGLASGGQARVVNLAGAALRARTAPGLTNPVIARIPEGRSVTILEGPVEADGYLWWRIMSGEASGWVAGRTPEGTMFLEQSP